MVYFLFLAVFVESVFDEMHIVWYVNNVYLYLCYFHLFIDSTMQIVYINQVVKIILINIQ